MKFYQKILVFLLLLILVFGSTAAAAPTGAKVTTGQAEISYGDQLTEINQSSTKATINWQSFNLNQSETVNFNQPGLNSITLNRILGNEKSVIDGALNANGQVWILNSSGVLFGANARVNTAGLLATTKELSDQDFRDANYSFAGNAQTSVINKGQINISDAGYSALLAKKVVNKGLITANLGEVHLSGGQEFSLNLNANSLVNLRVTKGELDSLVENKRAIKADGGKVYLTVNAVDDLLAGVVNTEGIIEARTIADLKAENSAETKTGYIEIFAHGGETKIDGKLITGKKEGFVETSGRVFNLGENAEIRSGHWLIDPTNINIDADFANTLNSSLNSGNVTINTEGSNADEGNIDINSDLSWSAATKLELEADNDINVNAVVENKNNNDGGIYFKANGDVYFADTGKVIINNIKQLQWIDTARQRENLTPKTSRLVSPEYVVGNYELGSDLDASLTNGSLDWQPIGNNSVGFKGNLDGKNYSINNFKLDSINSDLGLFSSLYNSDIRNLKFKNAEITGENRVGTLAGSASNTHIENVHTDSIVKGWSDVGGLVGSLGTAFRTIKNSSSSGSVDGYANVGGLVGSLNYSKIENSYSDADIGSDSIAPRDFAVRGTYNTGFGGLAGSSYNSQIINSYSKSNLDLAFENNVGGLVGYARESKVEDSYYQGTVIGNHRVGGLVGYLGLDSNYNLKASALAPENVEKALISNSWSQGTIKANYLVGGLAGETNGVEISNSYSKMSFKEPERIISFKTDLRIRLENTIIGGLIGGSMNSIIKNSYAASDFELPNSEIIGGLVGYGIDSKIENSYFKGQIRGSRFIGGLAGRMEKRLQPPGTIENSYAQAKIIADDYAAGLVGILRNEKILNSYAAVEMISQGENIGGLFLTEPDRTLAARLSIPELPENEIVASFYDKNLNPDALGETEYGKTTKELKDFATFKEAGWEIKKKFGNKNDYPELIFNENSARWIIEVAREIDGSEFIKDIYTVVLVVNDDFINNLNEDPVLAIGTEQVYLSELSRGGNDEGSTNNSEAANPNNNLIRVRVDKDSLIELINGGISLPEGVEQVFYLAEED
ncbi:GLUG motif-containing protein [Halanaerobium praevalens]|uniref:Filamentous hemagglutinin family outer membrane protein n=1 Tax=Halanaerobium praevalens (strain ATCC 33744 / DSM 2228 / GSL) TaxID=572479 RepID=E3DRC3_HALPG|nr:GLUG motif-containing protein [Halanaerobium praevalens]ADO78055.1 filamentous hemagglutinin family outer membrane protein [Halanaerobium praevalens DSM 2228]